MPKRELQQSGVPLPPFAAMDAQVDIVHLNVASGTELQVEIEGVYGTFKSELVGQREGRYLIIRTPLAPPGIATKLFRGNKVTVHYMEEGIAYGFQSDIVAAISDPEPLLFLAPPALLEEKSMRSARRIDALVPCVVAVRDKSTEGTIVDLSVEGCRCILPTHLPTGVLHLHLGDVILLLAAIGDPPLRLPGKVRNVTALKATVHVGIHFDKLPAVDEDRLVKYLIAQGVDG